VLIGVGGIEAEAVMLGQAISMILPKVVGYKLTGSIGSMVTSTDVVLTITKVVKKSNLFICVISSYVFCTSSNMLSFVNLCS